MNNKIKSIISVVVFAAFLVTVSSVCLAKPPSQYSDAERRELAQMPEVTSETLSNGEFSNSFENYTADQFPLRDILRGIKAGFSHAILGKADNNGLFYVDGHISKIDDPQNEDMMNHAAERFTYLYNTYLTDNDVYFTIVPDKNFILAKENGYPSLDYSNFIEKMKSKVDFMKYVDVTDLLEIDDYYKTDTHWKQENIADIAERLGAEMGTDVSAEYIENTLDNPFYGVYNGQYALPIAPDTIKYLTNDIIDNAVVTYYDAGMPRSGKIYHMEKAVGRDPYEMFLSGTMPLVTLENKSAGNNNHLILFRDSFGSSIAPLFLPGYSKITVIDTRYVQSEFLGNMIDFDGADVLFLYSTTLLNNSLAIR